MRLPSATLLDRRAALYTAIAASICLPSPQSACALDAPGASQEKSLLDLQLEKLGTGAPPAKTNERYKNQFVRRIDEINEQRTPLFKPGVVDVPVYREGLAVRPNNLQCDGNARARARDPRPRPHCAPCAVCPRHCAHSWLRRIHAVSVDGRNCKFGGAMPGTASAQPAKPLTPVPYEETAEYRQAQFNEKNRLIREANLAKQAEAAKAPPMQRKTKAELRAERQVAAAAAGERIL